MSSTQQWMIYGAYGYTGELMAREAVRRGMRPVLAGRSAWKLLPLAKELGLEYRAFDVALAQANVAGMSAVLNCAGPFSSTAQAWVEACLNVRAHYIDISGEIPVFQMCYAKDAEAEKAGIILCPGAGFDIVPTDCLAAMLKHQLPDAQTIDLAFSFGTRPSVGTARTIVESAKEGGLIRRDHALQAVGNGHCLRRIRFPGGARWSVTIPWGDVYTSGISTGVPNGMVYTALPLALGLLMRISSPFRGLMATAWAQKWLDRLAVRLFGGGPDAEARENQRSEFWGEAVSASGKRVSATISAPNVYALTVDTALTLTQHCLNATSQAGYFTPSILMGHEMIASRPGVEVRTHFSD
jgi:short subunit dehydrogenase-like uncharacterized protein